jgi:hypothetical protein
MKSILTITNKEEAIALADSYNKLNITLDHNACFKFLCVYFEVIHDQEKIKYRVAAQIYGPYYRYCYIFVQENIVEKDMKLFIETAFHEYLQHHDNRHIIHDIIMEHNLCCHEIDESNLYNLIVSHPKIHYPAGMILSLQKKETVVSVDPTLKKIRKRLKRQKKKNEILIELKKETLLELEEAKKKYSNLETFYKNALTSTTLELKKMKESLNEKHIENEKISNNTITLSTEENKRLSASLLATQQTNEALEKERKMIVDQRNDYEKKYILTNQEYTRIFKLNTALFKQIEIAESKLQEFRQKYTTIMTENVEMRRSMDSVKNNQTAFLALKNERDTLNAKMQSLLEENQALKNFKEEYEKTRKDMISFDWTYNN